MKDLTRFSYNVLQIRDNVWRDITFWTNKNFLLIKEKSFHRLLIIGISNIYLTQKSYYLFKSKDYFNEILIWKRFHQKFFILWIFNLFWLTVFPKLYIKCKREVNIWSEESNEVVMKWRVANKWGCDGAEWGDQLILMLTIINQNVMSRWRVGTDEKNQVYVKWGDAHFSSLLTNAVFS